MSDKSEKKKIAWSLWIPVILAFLLVIAAWTTLIKIAKENPVEQIVPSEATRPVAEQTGQFPPNHNKTPIMSDQNTKPTHDCTNCKCGGRCKK